MIITARATLKRCNAPSGRPRKAPPEEADEDDDGLELPVNPDEGTPLIPDDDERVVNVPS
ncbi:MAG: hypothetical protein ACYCZ6_10515 [Polaromonas sp.]